MFVLFFGVIVSCRSHQQQPPQQSGDDGEKKLKELKKRIEDLEADNFRLKVSIAKLSGDRSGLLKAVQSALSSEFESVQGLGADESSGLKNEEFTQLGDFLVSSLKNLSEPARMKLLQQVIQKGSDDVRKSMIEKTMLEDKSSLVRKEAIKGLHGLDSDFACSKIEKVLGEGDSEVTSAAILVLGDIKSERATALLLKLLESEKNDVLVERVIRALGETGQPSVSENILPYLSSAKDDLKWAAIASIGKLGDKKYAAEIGKQLTSAASDSIKQITIVSLGRLGSADSFVVVSQFLKSENALQTKESCVDYFRSVASQENCEAIARLASAEPNEKISSGLMSASFGGAGPNYAPLAKIWKVLSEGNNLDGKFECAKGMLACADSSAEQKKEAEAIMLSTGDTLYKAQRYRDAVWAYRSVAARAPQSIDTQFNLLDSLVITQNYTEAAVLLDDLLKKCDKSSSHFIDARVSAVKVMNQTGQYEKSLRAAAEILGQKESVISEESRKAVEDGIRSATKSLLSDLASDQKREEASKTLSQSFDTCAPYAVDEIASLTNDSARSAVLGVFNKNLSTAFTEDIFRDKQKLDEATANWKKLLAKK